MSQFKILEAASSQALNNQTVIANNFGPTPPSSPPVLVNGEALDQPDSPVPLYRTQSYDEVLFDIRKVPPEKLAFQLTLVDLPLFRAIRMEEFGSCSWNKKDKLRIAPNIVAFTRRFNHTSFWVVREIVKEENLRRRTEILTQFIRIAKKLQELNNVHSLQAVVAGLQSGPVYRLSQTWKLVARKERQHFERMEDFLSDSENRKCLREHMDAAKLPCIPHLGMYLTDLTYLESISARATPHHAAQGETILNMIAYCQNSTYDELSPDQPIQRYLTHVRYIEELQKFYEDENYQISLKSEPDVVKARDMQRKFSMFSMREPVPHPLRSSRSYEDILTPSDPTTLDSLSHSSNSESQPHSKLWTPQPIRGVPTRHSLRIDKLGRPVRTRGDSSDQSADSQAGTPQSPSPPPSVRTSANPSSSGMRSTLPNSFRASFGNESALRSSGRRLRSEPGLEPEPPLLMVDPAPLSDKPTVKAASSPSLKWKRERGHAKSQSWGSNMLSLLTKNSPTSSRGPSPEMPAYSRSLIDDSVLNDTLVSHLNSTPSGSLDNLTSSASSSASMDVEGEEAEHLCKRLEDADELLEGHSDLGGVLKEGYLKRKDLKRNGRSISLRRKMKFWVELTETTLLFYTSRPKPGKRPLKQKTKGVLLRNCRVKYREPLERLSDKQFILMVDDRGDQLKFSAKSSVLAQDWVVRIREAVAEVEEMERREVEKSLIKL